MNEQPLWRQAMEAVDGHVGGRLERVVNDESFAIAVGLIMRCRRGVGAEASRITTSLLHSLNLPSKNDVDRLLMQVASLEREVRAVADQTHTRPNARRRGNDADR